ncbi:MAG: ParA family protein [Limnoraphis sp.]
MSINIYAFYNNKGGVGKTTLCSQAAALYANKHPETQVLVIDLCPQANISQFLLGGGKKGYENNQLLQSRQSRKNIVGFVDWLLQGNSRFTTLNTSYKVPVYRFNPYISKNVYLIAGDSFLESFSLALNYAVLNPANINVWREFMTAIKRLCELEFNKKDYQKMVVFIDCNPSFSIYTQMALVSANQLIIPMTADYSSLEGIKGLFMLLFGKYPSAALEKYATNTITFNKQIINFNLQLPHIYEFVFNNFTIKEGIATAYNSIKHDLVEFCYQQFQSFPHCFTSSSYSNAMLIDDWERLYCSNIKDFHTSGRVSSSLGIPMFLLPEQSKYTMPDGEEVQLPLKNYQKALDDIFYFVDKLS